MIKKLLLLTSGVVFMFLCKITFAKEIDSTTAKKVAMKFYYEEINKFNPTNLKEIVITESYTIKSDNVLILYVFNIKKSGFVIVASDDKAYPIIGFSFESIYQEKNEPPALTEWLDNIGRQIKYSKSMSTEKNETIDEMWNYLLSDSKKEPKQSEINKYVNPLVTTKWDQGVYYNNMCPEFSSGPGGHAVTGCVATAMAQVMNYYKYPEHGAGSLTLDDSRFVPDLSADFGNTIYDWSKMPNYLNSNSTTEQINAVATLMYHCGLTVKMYYGPDESGSSNAYAPYGLVHYFKYQVRADYINKDDYTSAQWDSILIDNLEAGKPIMYSGSDNNGNGGHSWVCDGYKNSNYYHFNWGWGGSGNGYFYTGNAIAGGYNFSYYQHAVINIAPYFYPYCSEHKVYTDSSGSFGDGSKLSSYWNNTSCSWLISLADTTSKIALQFNSFSTEADKDILTIYDGDNNLAPILGSFSGHNIPGTIVSSGHKMYLQFITDSINQDSGWDVVYASTLTGINKTSIFGNISVYPNPTNDFLNLSFNNIQQKKISITLNTIIGVKVYSEKFLSNLDIFEKRIDLSGFSKGIYILTISADNDIINKKIIIE